MTPHEALNTLTRAVDDQPMWLTNRTHGYAFRLHGRHIAVIECAPTELIPAYLYAIRDILTGYVVTRGTRNGNAETLLEEMNVGLNEAERRHAERVRAGRH